MPSERYKSDPEYAEGYEASLRREQCLEGKSSAFIAGHAAAREAILILERFGFDETAPGKFSKSFTL